MKRPLLDYYGGKWKIADKIISQFPEHKTFVDVFTGGGSITLRKPPSKNEIINDIHSEIYNLFRVLRENTSELKAALKNTPYSRDEYNFCRTPADNPIEQARRTIVKSWFGIGDSLDNKTGFRVSLSQGGSTTKPWLKYIDYLESYAERLRGVIVENMDYKELLKRYDKPDTLFYMDPPYALSSRSKKHSYKHDWSNNDHREMIVLIKSLRGKVVLSGYDNEFYNNLGYKKISFTACTNGKKKIENIWVKTEGAGAC